MFGGKSSKDKNTDSYDNIVRTSSLYVSYRAKDISLTRHVDGSWQILRDPSEAEMQVQDSSPYARIYHTIDGLSSNQVKALREMLNMAREVNCEHRV